MKTMFLSLLFASTAALAIPAATAPLMQATTTHPEFQNLIKGSSSPFEASAYESLLLERVSPQEVQSSTWQKCTQGSRSGSLIRVTLQANENVIYYFGTTGRPADIELCQ